MKERLKVLGTQNLRLYAIALVVGIGLSITGCKEPEDPIVSVISVSLNKSSLSLAIGGSETLTATIQPENATNKHVKWTSNNENVATVSSEGKVTAKTVGTTTITATTVDGGKTASCTITVATFVTFNGVVASGSSTQTTTQLTLYFSQAISGLTTNDITLSGVSGVQKGILTNSGSTYTLPISGFTAGGTLSVAVSKSGFSISGSPKTVTIYYAIPVITINTHPTTTTNVTAGSISGSLAVSASVTPSVPLNYQWQQSSQSNFSSTTNVGTNNSTLTIPTGLAAGTYYFRCVVSADGAVSKTSNTATVVIAVQPVITISTHPATSTNVTVGSISGNLTVSASVTQSATLSYQWQQSGQSSFSSTTNVGTNSQTLTIPTGLTAGTYYFRCVVSATGAESKTSNTATVIVAVQPVITINTHPTTTTNVTAGSISGSLTVSASVTPSVTLSYQWQQSSQSNFSSTTIVGTSNSTLTIPTELTAGTYYFRCVVSADGAVSKTSNTATVIVAVQPVITINTHPATTTNVTAGSISGNLTVSASVTPSVTLSYQWQQSSQSTFSSTTIVGTNSSTLTIPTGLTAGTYYFRCVVSATGAESKTSNTATVIVAVQPVITINTHPTTTTNVTVGSISGSLSASASVTPTVTLSYQWQQSSQSSFSSTTNVGTNNSTLTIPTGLAVGTYYFRCVVSATGAASKTSNTATVNVAAISVTFSGITQNGSSTQSTTQLTLTFSQAITGLTASDITLGSISGVTISKGTLSGSGPTYTLPITMSGSTTSTTSSLSVAVSKTGYMISNSSRSVTVYPVTFSSATQNGNSTQTTTQLTLTFSQAITGLTASDITLGSISGVTISKGTLSTPSGSGPVTYTLPITMSGSITSASSSLSVSVAKSGYALYGSSKSVTVYPVTFNSITANGNETQTTTQLTLTFSQVIAGLTAADITLSGVSGVTKGTLSGSGPTYTLGITVNEESSIGGNLSVAVSKSGFAIYGSTKTVLINVKNIVFPPPDRDQLSLFLDWVDVNAQNGLKYVYYLNPNETVAPRTLSYAGKTDITIYLANDHGERFVDILGNGSLFTIEPGVTLTLGSGVTLRGRTTNTAVLVRINSGGKLILNDGAKITGNNNTSTSNTSYFGGGVYVNTGGIFEMDGGEISGNTAYYYGGGVYNSGTFTMTGGKISNNKTSYSSTSTTYGGGGVYVYTGTFTMTNGEISDNTVLCCGSGVYVYTGTFTMNAESIIFGNTARYGGGVYLSASNSSSYATFIMNGGTISYNINSSTSTSNSDGGGGVCVGNSYSRFTMNGGIISNNTAYYGGGVHTSGTFTLTDGIISNNTASLVDPSAGGGVYVSGGTFNMNNGEISDNRATSTTSTTYGGGVYVNGGTFTMNNTAKISGNTASNTTASTSTRGSCGGGVYVSSGNFNMNNGEISNNTASSATTSSTYGAYGGGVYVASSRTFVMTGGVISGNKAVKPSSPSSALGGGVYAAGTFNMEHGEISTNTAGNGGGVHVASTGVFTMINSNSVVSLNTASSNGGGVYLAGHTDNVVRFDMQNGIISGNTAASYGGGVYVGISGSTVGNFVKSGGIIYGYAGETTTNRNTATAGISGNNRGHTVYVESSPVKRKEDTAGTTWGMDSRSPAGW